jgi:uncharacterized membrane protein
MEKSKYSIQKRVDNNKQFYDLVKDGKVIFTTDNYNEVFNTFNNPSELPSDEQVLKNIERAKELKNTMRLDEIEQKYERPGTGVDMFIVLLMIFSVVGLFILAGELRLTDLDLVIAIGALVVQLILMGTILTSRKTDRALLDRLDEVEKKLDMYKKIKEENQ